MSYVLHESEGAAGHLHDSYVSSSVHEINTDGPKDLHRLFFKCSGVNSRRFSRPRLQT